MDELEVRPSADPTAWKRALHEGDDALLARLVTTEPPGVTTLQCSVALQGTYRTAALGRAPLDDAMRAKAERIAAVPHAVRRGLGPRRRDLDLGLLRWIHRAGTLSAVVGAGATMDAGGPSWAALVRRLLTTALERGRPITEPRYRETLEFPVVRVERFNAAREAEARAVLAAIDGGAADTELLWRGADLCVGLFGPDLVDELRQICYEDGRRPGAIHRAIADLAAPLAVPDRGPGLFPGWHAIVSYNYDDLVGEALDEAGLARAAWLMRGREVRGDPNDLALAQGQDGLYQSVYHLHGYVSRWGFPNPSVRFVLGAGQYRLAYPDLVPLPPALRPLDTPVARRYQLIDLVWRSCLATPVWHALYVGCSFSDPTMNRLLAEAAAHLPGRLHYALLRWPGPGQYGEASDDAIDANEARYLDFGVQPIWCDEFPGDLPDLIRTVR